MSRVVDIRQLPSMQVDRKDVVEYLFREAHGLRVRADETYDGKNRASRIAAAEFAEYLAHEFSASACPPAQDQANPEDD